MDAGIRRSSPLLIGVAWVVVVVPTLWGLTFTVQNAMKIFTHSAVTAPAPAPAPSVTPAPSPR